MSSAEDSVRRYVFLGFGGFLLYVAICMFLRSEILKEMCSSLSSALTWVKLHVCCFRTADEDEAKEKYVAQELKAHEVKCIDSFLAIFATILFVALSASWISALIDNDDRIQLPGQDALLCVGLLLALCGQYCKPTSNTAVYVWYVASIFYCVAYVQSSANLRFSILRASVQMACLRLCFIASGLSVLFVALGNIICCIGNYLAFIYAPADALSLSLEPLSFLCVDLVLSITIAFGSGVIRALAHREIHRSAFEKSVHFENDALTTLLENSYDVTLTLNEDNVLEGDSTRFAAMVMPDQARPLQGSKIQDFMPFEEDRENFTQQLQFKNVSDKPGVISVSVYLRDTLGCLFSVEIVGVAFRKIDQTIRYRLGIREVADLHLTPLRRLREGETEKKKKRGGRAARALGTSSSTHSTSLSSDSLGARNEALASVLEDANSKPLYLAVPNMKETTTVAKLSTTIALLRTWNVDVSRKPCCLLHAGLPALKQIVDMLSRGPCQDKLRHDVSSQCEACGLLGSLDESQKCINCGVDNSVPTMSL
eukprot:TRINITY_DN8694_c0_g1_i2.p1 TRINITY_DN8694_c0_g1~~TRINITY_DN8694_c0_g1_i2.p1  ORF type:complete len:539 (-),score=41.41 TRINITY_DN8694_c0_g1_i2:393-2009(-)